MRLHLLICLWTPLNELQNSSIERTFRGRRFSPIPRMKRLLPALRMRSATDRALACRWHLGTFPIHYCFLCSIGLQNYLDDLKLLMKKKTSPIESSKLKIALRVIASIPELEHPTVNQDWPLYELRLAAYLPRWRFLLEGYWKTIVSCFLRTKPLLKYQTTGLTGDTEHCS